MPVSIALVNHIVSGATSLSLDDAVLAASAIADPAGFIEIHLGRALIIDEIQRAPEFLRAIKLHVDRDRRPGAFILTGSANVLALPQLSETLAGRMELLTLRPFAQLELEAKVLPQTTFLDSLFAAKFANRQRSESREDILARVLRGGYPESVTRTEGRRESWFRSYLSGILNREARDVARLLDTSKLATLLNLLAARSTQPLNKTILARDLGVSWNTVEHYLALLEATFLITPIPAWRKHGNPRAGRHPKTLVNDSGLAASLLRVRSATARDEMTTLGSLLETFVGNEMLRLASMQPCDWKFAHYRTQRNEEVDFVVEAADGRVAGIEVKLSNTITAGDFRGMRALQRDAGEQFFRGVILYTGENTASFGEGLYAAPVTALYT